MADEQTLNHIMNEYEELRISAANERKKRIEEVNKKIPRVAEIDREIFQCGMENTKRIFKNPDKADEYNRDFKENLRKLENEKSHSYTSPYSNEYFDTLMEEVDNYEFEHDFNFDSYRDGVLQIHPELAEQPGFLENLDVCDVCHAAFPPITIYLRIKARQPAVSFSGSLPKLLE